MRTQLTITVVVVLLATPKAYCRDDAARLAEIRERAVFMTRLLRSIEFSYEVRSDDGWHAKAQYYGDDSCFRVNRTDVTGLLVGKTRVEPTTFMSAFNGSRRQLYNGARSFLRVKDGAEGAKYGVPTPHSTLYSWLPTSAGTLRWDEIQNTSLWRARFAEASYVGRTTEDGLDFDIVEFPHRLKTPCVFRVYFANQFECLPLRYERLLKETRQLASWVRANRYTRIRVDDHEIAFPLKVLDESTGLETAVPRIPKRTITLDVDANSLRINMPIDKAVFTIPTDIAKKFTDVDLIVTKSKLEIGSNSAPPRRGATFSGARSVLLWANIGFLLLILITVGVLKFKRKDQNKT